MVKTASLLKKLPFPAEKVAHKIRAAKVVSSKKHTKRVSSKDTTPALKKSIVPGSVVILLNGRFKGKRVIVLKQLPSGLLLVTGPFCVNGVPLKRVNQRFVIGTSTKVDISAVNVEKIDDSFFSREGQDKVTKEERFLQCDLKKRTVSASRLEAQKSVDAALKAVISKDKILARYLGTRFTLQSGVAPHTLKF